MSLGVFLLAIQLNVLTSMTRVCHLISMYLCLISHLIRKVIGKVNALCLDSVHYGVEFLNCACEEFYN